MPRPCVKCGSPDHTGFYCPNTARKPLKTTVQLKPKRRMRKLGKIGKALQQQRKDYLADIPPPYYCIYCQFLGIEYPLEKEAINVEHMMSKVRNPELRFVRSNLAISCQPHNKDKGSLNIDQYLEKLKEAQHAQGTNTQ